MIGFIFIFQNMKMEIILVLKFKKKPFKNFKLSKKKVKVRDLRTEKYREILHHGHQEGNTMAVRRSLVKVQWKNMLHIIWLELISWKKFFKKEILKI